MGVTHFDGVDGVNYTTTGYVTPTYSASKKDIERLVGMAMQDWFDPFAANTKQTITSDATIDIYPISQDPGATPGTRMVSIGGTDYRLSYRRNLPPNGWLTSNSYADQVYIHSVSGTNKEVSNLESRLEIFEGINQSFIY